MFITERYRLQNGANSAGNRDWPHGMRLVKKNAVKQGLSYRSILLAIGIGVALIVLLTFWASQKGTPLSFANPVATVLSEASEVSFLREFVRKVSEVRF